jgi:hypothetical protein
MNHPNIVKLKEVIRENDMLFFVFEYMVQTINTRAVLRFRLGYCDQYGLIDVLFALFGAVRNVISIS